MIDRKSPLSTGRKADEVLVVRSGAYQHLRVLVTNAIYWDDEPAERAKGELVS